MKRFISWSMQIRHEVVISVSVCGYPQKLIAKDMVITVAANWKLTTCANWNLTRWNSGIAYYTAVDKSTKLRWLCNETLVVLFDRIYSSDPIAKIRNWRWNLRKLNKIQWKIDGIFRVDNFTWWYFVMSVTLQRVIALVSNGDVRISEHGYDVMLHKNRTVY
jgi:hypothetical protein